MKYHQIIAALGCAMFTITLAEAKTITVDNKVGSVAMYNSVQSACDAAEPGDTILIAGSPTNYGHAIITKKLHLVGPGYWLAENGIPGITKDSATLSIIYAQIELSSSNESSATGLAVSLNVTPGAGNIHFDKCHIFNPIFSSRVTIKRSFLNYATLVVSGSSMSNCLIGQGGNTILHNGTTASHCVIQRAPFFSSVAGSSISNSIFITESSLTASVFAANVKGSVTHSLSVGGLGIGGNPTFLPSGNGNIPTVAFTVQAFVQGQTNDKAYVLAAGSPAIGSGLNGVDMGIFGGVQPYVISGVPSLPRITRFLVPSTATSTSGLRIEMDAESF